MANVPLKSIQFPGLDDVYTVTQLANNLTSAGKAADSKVVGDAVSEIRSASNYQKLATLSKSVTASGQNASQNCTVAAGDTIVIQNQSYDGDNLNYVDYYFLYTDNTNTSERSRDLKSFTYVPAKQVKKIQAYIYLTASESASFSADVYVSGTLGVEIMNLKSADKTIEADIDALENQSDTLEYYMDTSAINAVLHGLFERKNYNASTGKYEASTTKIAITKPCSFAVDVAVKAESGYMICIIDTANPPVSVTWTYGGYITAGTKFNIIAAKGSGADFPLTDSVNVVFEPINTAGMFADSDTFKARFKSMLAYAYLNAAGTEVQYYQYKQMMNINKILAEKDIYIVNPLSDEYGINVTTYDGEGNVTYNNYANKNNPYQITKGQYFRLVFNHVVNNAAVDVTLADIFAGATITLCDDIEVINPEQSNIIPALSNKGFVRESDPGKRFAAMVYTDIHKDLPRFRRIMEYINNVTEIDCGICLGDMANDNYAESDGTWYTGAVNNCNKAFYTVIGNHDGGNVKAANKSGTVDQIFAKWIEPTLSKIGIDGLTKTYYSIKDDTYKVVLIVLNDFDVPDTTVAGGDFAVSRGLQCYSQAQIDWLIETLGDVPSDYHVCILEHWIGFANEAVDNQFTQYGFNAVYQDPAYPEIICDIVNAWQTGGSLTQDYAPQKETDYLSTLEVDCDFSSRGTGIFIGYLSGHAHRDFIGRSTNHTSQNVIALCMSTLWSNYSDLPRKIGTKSEDVVTLVTFDTVNRAIILYRVGASVTDKASVKEFAKITY